MPIWACNHKCTDFYILFKLQKKAIRIVANQTIKIDGRFQHTKPIFKKLNILTIHNLYFYHTACEAIKVLSSKKPNAIFNLYALTPSRKLILPKFKKEKLKTKSFIFNSSKILNFISANKIDYKITHFSTFKLNLKRFLMNRQGISLNNDPNWLPLNYSLFSDVKIM